MITSNCSLGLKDLGTNSSAVPIGGLNRIQKMATATLATALVFMTPGLSMEQKGLSDNTGVVEELLDSKRQQFSSFYTKNKSISQTKTVEIYKSYDILPPLDLMKIKLEQSLFLSSLGDIATDTYPEDLISLAKMAIEKNPGAFKRFL